ncbi:MAG: SufE family protein [Actinobacteria bacterium]|nr:SufE family protein [Actinomycetota bacterium]
MRDKLHEIVEEFADTPKELRLPLLLDFANSLPPLPDRLVEDRDSMEPVEECQAPLFLAVEVQPVEVRLFFDAPMEAPTSRGFAAVLHEGLDGASPEEVLATPNDFYLSMGLEELVTPLRMRGMAGMLARVKRRVAAGIEA